MLKLKTYLICYFVIFVQVQSVSVYAMCPSDGRVKKMTREVQEAIGAATHIAHALGSSIVLPEHVLLALTLEVRSKEPNKNNNDAQAVYSTYQGWNFTNGTLPAILKNAGFDVKSFQDFLLNRLGYFQHGNNTPEPPFERNENGDLRLNLEEISENTQSILNRDHLKIKEDEDLIALAENAATKEELFRQRNNKAFFNTPAPEHFLLGILNADHAIRDFLFTNLTTQSTWWQRFTRTWGGLKPQREIDRKTAEVTDKLYQSIHYVRGEERTSFTDTQQYANSNYNPPASSSASVQNASIPYTTENLTRKAEEGKLSKGVSDPNLIIKVAQALTNIGNSSVAVTGLPGTGRETLIHDTIHAIMESKDPNSPYHGKIDPRLVNIGFFRLNSEHAVAGTRYSGDLEKNMLKMKDAIANCNGQCILVVDDLVRDLFEKGPTEGSPNDNIGSSLLGIMKKAAEDPHSGGLRIVGRLRQGQSRNFMGSQIGQGFTTVDMPTPDQRQIESVSNYLFDQNNLNKPLFTSTQKTLIMDRALFLANKYYHFGSEYFKSRKTLLDNIFDYAENNLNETQKDSFHQLQRDIKEGLSLDIIQERIENLQTSITIQDIDIIVGEALGMPVETYAGPELYHSLENFVQSVRARFKGYGSLVEDIGNMLLGAASKMTSKPERPTRVILLLGPPGIGKTILVETIGKFFHPGKQKEDAIIKVRGSTATIESLLGNKDLLNRDNDSLADNQSLTAKVINNPRAVIYINEVNQMPSSILNILMNIFEDGVIEDSKGRLVSFQNTMIFLDLNPDFSLLKYGFNAEQMEELRINERSKEDLDFIMKIRNNQLNDLNPNELAPTQREIIAVINGKRTEEEITPEDLSRAVENFKRRYPAEDLLELPAELKSEAIAQLRKEFSGTDSIMSNRNSGGPAAFYRRIDHTFWMGFLSRDALMEVVQSELDMMESSQKTIRYVVDPAVIDFLVEEYLQMQDRASGFSDIRSRIENENNKAWVKVNKSQLQDGNIIFNWQVENGKIVINIKDNGEISVDRNGIQRRISDIHLSNN